MAQFIAYTTFGDRSLRSFFTPTWRTGDPLPAVGEPSCGAMYMMTLFYGNREIVPQSKVFEAECFWRALERCWPARTTQGLFRHRRRDSNDMMKVYDYAGTPYVIQRVL
jgi:hypothetical protein